MARSLRSERGVALPVVLGCLLVLSILAAGLLTTATRSSSNTNESRASKRALGAAEAGLQTAAYRLNALDPPATMCMTTPIQQANTNGAAAPTATGECPASQSELVAARATFRYWVTPIGATCGSLPGSTPSGSDRCITSVGIVNEGQANEVTRRIQARIEIDDTPFSIAGLVGTDSVTLTNKVTIDKTDVGSNGPITLNGSPERVEIKEAAAMPYPPGPPGGTVIRSGTTTIGPPPGNNIVNSPSRFGLSHPDFAPSRTTNNNAALKTKYPLYFDTTTRSLNVPEGKKVDLPPGTYNFCSWTMNKDTELNMSPGESKATIFLDSPRDPSSGCPAGSGQFKSVQKVNINNGKPDANISVYVLGTTVKPGISSPVEDIVFQNESHIDGVWFAPDSIFRASGRITMHGGVVARHIRMYNDVKASLDVAFDSLETPGAGLLSRRAWFECRPEPTDPADPESGC